MTACAARSSLATKLTFDAIGGGAPQGNTVANPVALVWVTVTFTATAVAYAGNNDVIERVTTEPAATGAAGESESTRVSSARVGSTSWNCPPPLPNQPVTSTIMCAATEVKTHNCRVESTGANTMLATGESARVFTLEMYGRGEPQGYAVANPSPAASVSVTVAATPVAPTGTTDSSCTRATQPAPTPDSEPAVVRVSSNRVGVIGVNPPATPAVGSPSAGATHGAAAPWARPGIATTQRAARANSTNRTSGVATTPERVPARMIIWPQLPRVARSPRAGGPIPPRNE